MTIEGLKKYRKVLILGYGIEGKSTERFFKKFLSQIEIIVADQKDGPNYLSRQDEAGLVIKSPGVKKNLVYKPYTTPTNIFFANAKMKIIGITGTKGKSTLASLIHAILNASGSKNYLLGNIGNPMLDALTNGYDQDAIAVVELSSYQLDDMKYSPHIACFLNIYPETHNHKSYDDYFQAKSHITLFQKENDFFVYNPKFPQIENLTKRTLAKKVPIDLSSILQFSNSALSGPHNLETVASAVAIANILNIKEEEIEIAISNYKALPHRMNYVGRFKEIEFYNDSSANNPAATMGALVALSPVHTLLLGGQDRGFDFKPVVDKLNQCGVKSLVLFPDTDAKIINLIIQNEYKDIKMLETDSMKEAVDFIFKQTSIGEKCLLSPGAPSYLMYENFSARGDDFVNKVKNYEKKKNT